MGFFPSFSFCYFIVGVQICFQFLCWLCILLFCQIHLLGQVAFFVETMGFSMYSIMFSVNNDSFTASFPTWVPFISFYCLIAVARTSSTMLNKSGESGHPCLVLDLKGEAFSFCPVIIMLATFCKKCIFSVLDIEILSFSFKWLSI